MMRLSWEKRKEYQWRLTSLKRLGPFRTTYSAGRKRPTSDKLTDRCSQLISPRDFFKFNSLPGESPASTIFKCFSKWPFPFVFFIIFDRLDYQAAPDVYFFLLDAAKGNVHNFSTDTRRRLMFFIIEIPPPLFLNITLLINFWFSIFPFFFSFFCWSFVWLIRVTGESSKKLRLYCWKKIVSGYYVTSFWSDGIFF